MCLSGQRECIAVSREESAHETTRIWVCRLDDINSLIHFSGISDGSIIRGPGFLHRQERFLPRNQDVCFTNVQYRL